MILIEKVEFMASDYNPVKIKKKISNIVSNFNTAEYSKYETLAGNISDTILKYVAKHRNHDIIMQREILKLETPKAYKDADIPTKSIKENVDTFAGALPSILDDFVEKSNFPSSLRTASVTPAFKKR